MKNLLLLTVAILSLNSCNEEKEVNDSITYREVYTAPSDEVSKYYLNKLKERHYRVYRDTVMIDGVSTSIQIHTDEVLIPGIARFMDYCKEYDININDRLADTEFIVLDYLPNETIINGSFITKEKYLGRTYLLAYEKDFIILNSHLMGDNFELNTILYHELGHLFRNDGYHCIEENCAMIMRPGSGSIDMNDLKQNLPYHLDVFFKELKLKVNGRKENNNN